MPSSADPTQPDQKQVDALSVTHLAGDLRGRTVRGLSVTLLTQGAAFVLNFGSLAVLARLLEPDDFGIMAMAAVFTGFLSQFRDLGLSTATIQRAGGQPRPDQQPVLVQLAGCRGRLCRSGGAVLADRLVLRPAGSRMGSLWHGSRRVDQRCLCAALGTAQPPHGVRPPRWASVDPRSRQCRSNNLPSVVWLRLQVARLRQRRRSGEWRDAGVVPQSVSPRACRDVGLAFGPCSTSVRASEHLGCSTI